MPLMLLKTNLTHFPCDAIVVATDSSMQSGGSVFGAVCSCFGPAFMRMVRKKERISVGNAALLGDHDELSVLPMKCRNVILTAAPVWKDGKSGEIQLLAQCYRSSLELAYKNGYKKIGIALIDSSFYGFPAEIAVNTAVEAVQNYPELHNLDVYLIEFDHFSYEKESKKRKKLSRYIEKFLGNKINSVKPNIRTLFSGSMLMGRRESEISVNCESMADAALDERLKNLDESFAQKLFRKIDESGMTDVECYKKANISKQIFSKIRSNQNYRPQKNTVLSLAAALELDLEETNELLGTLGMTLSHSSKSDIIIEFCILNGIYNVFEINELLYEYDQSLLGSD